MADILIALAVAPIIAILWVFVGMLGYLLYQIVKD